MLKAKAGEGWLADGFFSPQVVFVFALLVACALASPVSETTKRAVASALLKDAGVPYVDWNCLSNCGLNSASCVLTSGCLLLVSPTAIATCLAPACGISGTGCIVNCFM